MQQESFSIHQVPGGTKHALKNLRTVRVYVRQAVGHLKGLVLIHSLGVREHSILGEKFTHERLNIFNLGIHQPPYAAALLKQANNREHTLGVERHAGGLLGNRHERIPQAHTLKIGFRGLIGAPHHDDASGCIARILTVRRVQTQLNGVALFLRLVIRDYQRQWLWVGVNLAVGAHDRGFVRKIGELLPQILRGSRLPPPRSTHQHQCALRSGVADGGSVQHGALTRQLLNHSNRQIRRQSLQRLLLVLNIKNLQNPERVHQVGVLVKQIHAPIREHNSVRHRLGCLKGIMHTIEEARG